MMCYDSLWVTDGHEEVYTHTTDIVRDVFSHVWLHVKPMLALWDLWVYDDGWLVVRIG